MASPKERKVAIGIDLGTSNSCVAVVDRNGRVEIIANDVGNRVTPSVVAFTDTDRLVGEAAKAQATWNPRNTVYQVKRLMGQNFSDKTFQKALKTLSYEIIAANNSKVGSSHAEIKVTHKNELKRYSPEQISSMVLRKMKDTAKNYLGVPVSEAVITVPAYFNDSQRQSTIDAATIAGLKVLKIINEPTAAAIAYGSSKPQQSKRNVLIYDFGGGTLDVAIIAMQGNNYNVQAVSGDTFLGGSDFDNILVDYFAKQFKIKHKCDISNNTRSLAKLRKACEKAKRKLSYSVQEDILIESLYNGIDFKTSLSRARFNELCSELFKKSLDYVQKALNDAKMEKINIGEVVLVGGSTRIPMIQSMLQDFFDGVAPNKTINPDEAVAYGAAIQAAMLARDETVEQIFLRDVTPLSLGISTDDPSMDISDEMYIIIKRNSEYPIRKTRTVSTISDYLKTQSITVYEGEQQTASHNNLLGEFVLTGIEQALKGIPNISVTFSIDENGILEVTAVDQKTNSSAGITITSHRGRLEKKDIDRMMIEDQKLELDEQERLKNRDARNSLEIWLQQQKTQTEQRKRRIPSSSSAGEAHGKLCEEICNNCDLTILRLEGNHFCQEGDYQRRKREIQNLIGALDNLDLQ